MLIGAVMLVCAGGSAAGFTAWQSSKGMTANLDSLREVPKDRSVGSLETVRPKPEPLAATEQNL
ncbi:hypothetical protein NIES2104_63700 [Leptolyngbya sp. NIES-2104]|nr:hypothetical protein NIES2104_63700 [Leptolyngbya sp. NIES-2104]